MINELLQLNSEELHRLEFQRDLEGHLNKQAAIAKEYINSSIEQRMADAAEARIFAETKMFESHVSKSADRGVDIKYNFMLEAELNKLNQDTIYNLKSLRNEDLEDFIAKQREIVEIATQRYEELRQEHQTILNKLEEVQKNGGDYFAVRDAVYKSEKNMDENIATLIDARDNLNSASEQLRERMFNRGEYLETKNHPVASAYKETLIEHDLAKGNLLRNLVESNGLINSFDTDAGRLHQQLATAEISLRKLEAKWDALIIERELIDSAIAAIEKDLPADKYKLSDEDFHNSATITKRGKQDIEELKSYYRDNTFDNFSVGAKSNYGSGPNIGCIDAREIAFLKRQESLIAKATELMNTDKLQGERIDAMRSFEYHEYKASVYHKLGSTPGVGVGDDFASEQMHDEASGKYASKLAGLDYKIAYREQKTNPELQLPVRLAVLYSNVEKAEQIKELYTEQLQTRHNVNIMAEFSQVFVKHNNRYEQMKEDLTDLRERGAAIAIEAIEVSNKKNELTGKMIGMNEQMKGLGKLNPAARRLAEKRAELGVAKVVVNDEDIKIAREKSASLSELVAKQNQQNKSVEVDQGMAR